MEKFNSLQGSRNTQQISKQEQSDNLTIWNPDTQISLTFPISISHLFLLGDKVFSAVWNSTQPIVSRRSALKSATTSEVSSKVLRVAQVLITIAAFSLALLGHSLGFTRLANPGAMGVKEKLTRVLGTSTQTTNEFILSKNLGLGNVQTVGPLQPKY